MRHDHRGAKGDQDVASVLDISSRLAGDAGVVEGDGSDTRGDGSDRRILEAGLRGARRIGRVTVGQRATREERAWTKDRSRGRSMACQTAPAWPFASEFYPLACDPRSARSRLRRKTVEMISRVENRAQKVLEACGVKLGSVVSNVFGATGRAILKELAANHTDPILLAELARGSLKKKKREISSALEGSFSAH